MVEYIRHVGVRLGFSVEAMYDAGCRVSISLSLSGVRLCMPGKPNAPHMTLGLRAGDAYISIASW